jgi:hypothetical protein
VETVWRSFLGKLRGELAGCGRSALGRLVTLRHGSCRMSPALRPARKYRTASRCQVRLEIVCGAAEFVAASALNFSYRQSDISSSLWSQARRSVIPMGRSNARSRRWRSFSDGCRLEAECRTYPGKYSARGRFVVKASRQVEAGASELPLT